MKDLLIFTHGMEIGGVERALLGLLNSLDTTRCQTDLFLMRHYGALLHSKEHQSFARKKTICFFRNSACYYYKARAVWSGLGKVVRKSML